VVVRVPVWCCFCRGLLLPLAPRARTFYLCFHLCPTPLALRLCLRSETSPMLHAVAQLPTWHKVHLCFPRRTRLSKSKELQKDTTEKKCSGESVFVLLLSLRLKKNLGLYFSFRSFFFSAVFAFLYIISSSGARGVAQALRSRGAPFSPISSQRTTCHARSLAAARHS
jgi:hypothetical protein